MRPHLPQSALSIVSCRGKSQRHVLARRLAVVSADTQIHLRALVGDDNLDVRVLLAGLERHQLIHEVLAADRHRFEGPAPEHRRWLCGASAAQSFDLESPVSGNHRFCRATAGTVGIVERHVRLPGTRWRRRRALEHDPAGRGRATAHHNRDVVDRPAPDVNPRAPEELLVWPAAGPGPWRVTTCASSV